MLLGFDDTILGVGAPEVAIILAVGYFVLGPVELFKLTKQAGVLVGQLRDIGLGTATNLGNIMDDQVLRFTFCLAKLYYIVAVLWYCQDIRKMCGDRRCLQGAVVVEPIEY